MASFAGNVPAASSRRARSTVSLRSLFAVILGNGLELYDFAVYSFFSVIIGHLFFPVSSDYASLLLAVATFGVGFVMRPLGSVILGQYADRHGRRAGMTLILVLMAAGMMLVAFAPTWQQIGIFAPVMLVAGRMLQGFSAGGEVGVATSWLLEAGDRASSGSRVCWQIISQGAAALLGSGIGVLLMNTLSHDALYSWGWRVPFIIGLLIMPVGVYIRRHLEETHAAAASGKAEHTPAAQLWREHKRELVLGILLVMKLTIGFYLLVYYMPAYMVNTLHRPAATSYWVSLLASAITLVTPWFGGKIADRVARRKPVIIASSLCSMVLIWPIFSAIGHDAPLPLILSLIALDQICVNLGTVAFFLLLLEAFPRPVRSSGMAIVYAVGVSLFGGTAQFNVTWLLQATGNAMAPAWYLLFAAVVSFGALLAWRERPHH